jgi:hypothetical protein
MLYVPDAWAHGVLNLAESVGYAFEFEVYATMDSVANPRLLPLGTSWLRIRV